LISLLSFFHSFSEDDKLFVDNLKKLLLFKPTNLNLYKEAFTHKSISSSENKHNERLEYLGDAILGKVISEYLFINYPDANEGFLTTAKSNLVSRNLLNKIGKKHQLDTFLKTNIRQEELSENMIGNALEALIGAIYLDKGIAQTKNFIVEKIIKDANINELITDFNHKGKLLELSAKKEFKVTFNTYNLQSQTRFVCELYINEKLFGKEEGSSKKQAEQSIAKKALAYLQENPII
jgi:ribonuclease III